MSTNKATPKKQKPNAEFSLPDKAELPQKHNKKRTRIPKFDEDDMYKVKYDF